MSGHLNMHVPTSLIIVTGVLLLWNLTVIHFISRFFYEFFKSHKRGPAEYIGRKVIHILSGGVTALLVPIFYDGYYWVVALMSFLLACYLLFMRKQRMMYWFQVEENSYEVHFAAAYGLMILVGFYLKDIWIGLIPILFMSLGDAVTGIVRALNQKKQIKSWDGTFTMFIVCSLIALWKMGVYGIFVGALASLVERIPGIDDNLTVPLVTALCLYLQTLF